MTSKKERAKLKRIKEDRSNPTEKRHSGSQDERRHEGDEKHHK